MYLRTVLSNVTVDICGRLTAVKGDVEASGNKFMDLLTNVLDFAKCNHFATLLPDRL